MEQQHNKGKVEGFLAELGRKVDYLLDRARQGAEEARLSEKIEELKKTTDKLENELHEFVQDNEKWREVQTHLQGAAQELRKAFETTFKSRKGNEQEPAQQQAQSQHNPTFTESQTPPSEPIGS